MIIVRERDSVSDVIDYFALTSTEPNEHKATSLTLKFNENVTIIVQISFTVYFFYVTF